MKYLIFACFALLISCSSDSSESKEMHDFNGDWKLIELLQDPGDLSGQFEPTDIDVLLSIENNESVTSNGLLCGFNESSDMQFGSLSAVDSTITSSCAFGEMTYKISIEQSYLILSSLQSREPYRAKFERNN